MQISTVFLMVSLAGTAALQVHGQTASPELQGKALELLHQTLAQERQPATAVIPVGQPVSADQQQRALQLLREKTSEPLAATDAVPAKSAPASKSQKPAKASSAKPASASPTGAIAAPTAPEPSTISKGKQQRLADLLEQYRADKITPAEYHAQRAKILSEP